MTHSGESDSEPIRVGLQLPKDVKFGVGNVIRTAWLSGQGWTAKVELEARSAAAMEAAVKCLADLFPGEIESTTIRRPE